MNPDVRLEKVSFNYALSSKVLTMSNVHFRSRLLQHRRDRWIFETTSLKAIVPLDSSDVKVMGKRYIPRIGGVDLLWVCGVSVGISKLESKGGFVGNEASKNTQ